MIPNIHPDEGKGKAHFQWPMSCKTSLRCTTSEAQIASVGPLMFPKLSHVRLLLIFVEMFAASPDFENTGENVSLSRCRTIPLFFLLLSSFLSYFMYFSCPVGNKMLQ